MQYTVSDEIVLDGIGVHSGAPAKLVIRPAQIGTGVMFERTDRPAGENRIPARFDLVVDTRLCTVLSNMYGASVSTVEHLMGALAACGVDNALIEIDGPEIPIMDGSAEPFVRAILKVGLQAQAAPLRVIRVLREVSVTHGDKTATLAPAEHFAMDYEIDFTERAIGHQTRSAKLVNGAVIAQLADSRTFGRLADVEALRAAGFARGGSLDNAIVVDGDRVLNRDGLRHSDEFVRHKMLDAVGDLALAGAPIIGRYTGLRAGHDMTNRLLRALFEAPDAWRYDIIEDRASVTPCAPVALNAPAQACA